MVDVDAEYGSGGIPDRISEVIENQLYLGNMWEAQSTLLRQKHGITHVLSVCPDIEDMNDVLLQLQPELSSSPRHLVISVKDSETADLMSHFPATFEFIDSALTTGGRVFVHCALGLSRSPTVIAAYLIRKRGLSVGDALALIRESREYIMPNAGFVHQLHEYSIKQLREEYSMQRRTSTTPWSAFQRRAKRYLSLR
ncbi:phosphatases II [Hymenopellis radicata]|nr:phosphatases II [Hymenopellis radicata]